MAYGGSRNPYDFHDLKKALSATVVEDGGTSAGENFDRFFDIKPIVTGLSVEDPDAHITGFKQAGLGPRLRSNIRTAGFDRPLPIQQYAIPYITGGFDVIGHSITGSGKTAAYILPIVDALYKEKNRRHMGHPIYPCQPPQPRYMHHSRGGRVDVEPQETVYPKALILAPTRELAIQISDEFDRFSKGLRIYTKLLYGGEKNTVKDQMADVRNGDCEILVATPGRLKNCIDRKDISMANIEYFVLDEADQMLDKKFGPDIKYIVESGMPAKNIRHTLLFSATFPADVQKMCKKYMEKEYVFISVGERNSANSDITQELIKTTTTGEKMGLLLQILKDHFKDHSDHSESKVLIFVQTKEEADSVAARLKGKRFLCTKIHSQMQQVKREEALDEFKEGTKPILVATSVAARGLDICNLDLVINYSLPQNIAEYVQRIGRTGRVGNKGRAIAFYDPQVDHGLGDGLVKVLEEASKTNTDQVVPRWLLEATGRGDGPRYLDD